MTWFLHKRNIGQKLVNELIENTWKIENVNDMLQCEN